MLPNSSRTYHDPLHGGITLDSSDPTEALLIQLIDTPEFQRLRRIRQLGPASLTFHGAEASRFTHSLGVMAIARRVFDQLCEHYPALRVHRSVVLCSALLHDLGHGPFSHTAEEIFGCQHEHWTARILLESAPITQRLKAGDPHLRDAILQVYRKQYPVPLVWQLVSSQLDCDRLDYLMRDSYFTGASYGKLDLDRIVTALGYDPVSQQLVVAQKGMAAVEHYLIVRYFMYAQVYNHPKNIAATWVLEQAFQRAARLLALGQLIADATVTAWLTPQHSKSCDQSLSLKAYLDADDGVFTYHLQQWQSSADPLLADLCRRFINRELPKCHDISHLDDTQQQQLLAKVHHWLAQTDLEPGVYAGIRVSFSRGYTLYQKGIKIQTTTGLAEISELSSLVRALTQPYKRSWLIYPDILQSHLTTMFSAEAG